MIIIKTTKRKSMTLFITILITFLFTACWNNQDLTDIGVVAGVGLDKTPDGKIELTVQLINPSAIKEGTGDHNDSFVLVSGTGKTTFEAVRNLIAKVNRKSFFGHTQVIILGENVATENISEIVDIFERGHKTRRRANVIVARGIGPKEILGAKSDLEQIPSINIAESIETSQYLSKAPQITLLDMLKHFGYKGRSFVVPTIHYDGSIKTMHQEDIQIEGATIIKKGKIDGYLTPIETRGFMFADNQVVSTIITVPSPLNNKKAVSVEVLDSTGNIDVKFRNDKLVLEVEVEADGSIASQHEHGDLTKIPPIKKLEDRVETEIKNEILNTVEITQKKYQSDIFGFINVIYRNDYDRWKEVVNDWDNIYRSAPVNVKVSFNIRRPGLIRTPTNPQ